MARSNDGSMLIVLGIVGYFVYQYFLKSGTGTHMPSSAVPPGSSVQPAPGSTATSLAPGSIVTDPTGSTSVVQNDGTLTIGS